MVFSFWNNKQKNKYLVLPSFDKDEAVCAVLQNVSKTFYSVDREIKKKLECYDTRKKHKFVVKIIFSWEKSVCEFWRICFNLWKHWCWCATRLSFRTSVVSNKYQLLKQHKLKNYNFIQMTNYYIRLLNKTHKYGNFYNLNLKLFQISYWLIVTVSS